MLTTEAMYLQPGDYTKYRRDVLELVIACYENEHNRLVITTLSFMFGLQDRPVRRHDCVFYMRCH